MKPSSRLFMVSLSVALAAAPLVAYADAISPAIKNDGKKYSKEPPDIGMYGTGVGGRLMEASMLRFEVERLLQDADYDKAILKAKKACQLDPADPDTHLLLARALTQKLEGTKGAIDEKILVEAMHEWQLIWLHDSDPSEQMEGKLNFMRMKLVAHGLAKQKQIEAKTRAKQRESLAEHDGADDDAGKGQTDSNTKTAADAKQPAGKGKQSADAADQANADKDDIDGTGKASNQSNDGKAIAQKHKRFGLF